MQTRGIDVACHVYCTHRRIIVGGKVCAYHVFVIDGGLKEARIDQLYNNCSRSLQVHIHGD